MSSANLNASKKPHESSILKGLPPPSPINFESRESPLDEHLKEVQSRKIGRVRKQADPGPGMVPKTQIYQANTVKFEPNTYDQAMKSEDHNL